MKFVRCKVLSPHNLTAGMLVELSYDQWERRRHCLEAADKTAQHVVSQRFEKDGKTPVGRFVYRIKEPVIFKVGEEVYLEESIMASKAIRLYYEDQDAPKESPTPAAQASSQAQGSQDGQQQSSESDAGGEADEEQASEQEETAAEETAGAESETEGEAAADYSTWHWTKLKAEVEARGGVWNTKAEAIEFLILDDQTRSDGAADENGAQE